MYDYVVTKEQLSLRATLVSRGNLILKGGDCFTMLAKTTNEIATSLALPSLVTLVYRHPGICKANIRDPSKIID
jgi:hypothetical protein